MAHDDMQQLLARISDQTGQPTPSAEDIQSFLNAPGSQLLLQAILGAQSPTLTAAASLARSGNFDHASDLLKTYLNTPEGQELIHRLSGNGGTQ
ncbi:MAG: hypothetical protein Q4F79_10740 [Eubacteriales bacterium]|nr:hypothetical protein [Eubacteriales bacterium]